MEPKVLLILLAMLDGNAKHVFVLDALSPEKCKEFTESASRTAWDGMIREQMGDKAYSVMRCDPMPDRKRLIRALAY